MSSFRNVTITCPDCGAEGEYTIWNSVNVTINPELKYKIMYGSIFNWTCPKCGKIFNVPYPFLYHDMNMNSKGQSFMVQYQPETPIVLFAEYIRIADNALSEKAIYFLEQQYRDNHPGENILFDGMTKEGLLSFDILKMPNGFWEKIGFKYFLPYSDYEREAAQFIDCQKEKYDTVSLEDIPEPDLP